MNLRSLDLIRAGIGLLACSMALVGMGCARDPSPKAVAETAYVRGGSVPLRDQLGPTGNVVATLQGGEKADVLSRRARWVQVRLPDGKTGWLHTRFLASSQLFGQFQELARNSAATPPQGRALIRREANLHVEAGSATETFYRLPEKEAVEVIGHRLVDRPEQQAATARPGKSDADNEPDSEQEEPITVEVHAPEDWILVRASGGRVGWLREGYLDMDPPIEIGRYNEGMRIRAWFVLFQENDSDGVHPWYLWATIHPRPGLPFDYDEIRVFVWNPNKSRYETSYRERNLVGFFPIVVQSVQTKDGEAPGFRLLLEDHAGKRFEKSFVMVSRVVKSQS